MQTCRSTAWTLRQSLCWAQVLQAVLCSLSNTPHITALKATQQYSMSLNRHQQLLGGAYRLSKGKLWVQLLQQQTTHGENEHTDCTAAFVPWQPLKSPGCSKIASRRLMPGITSSSSSLVPSESLGACCTTAATQASL